MYWFKQARVAECRIDVAARRESHAADDDRRKIGENVTKQIAGDDNIETLGPAYELHHRAIDEQRFGLNLRVILRHRRKNFVPQNHAVALRVALRNGGDSLTRTCDGLLKRGADDSLATAPREDGSLNSNVVVRALIDATADIGVLPLGVLAKHEHVDRAGCFAVQRTVYAVVQVGGTQTDTLIETPSNRQ